MKPINNVTVVSTGNVRIRPEHRETNGTPLMWWLNTSRQWTEPLPINVYVIEHEKGLVLFDTGQDRRSVTDPEYFPGGPAGHIYRRLAKFDVPAGETLTERLRDQGYDIADVRVAIVSHLHQDHIGGLRELPKSAQILVSAAELAEVDKKFAAFAGLMREHIHIPGVTFTALTPQRVDDPAIAPFTHAHDVMGDGSLLLLPTPGHTPGSMSLLLRGQGLPPMLFVGDITYDVERLAANRIPGVGDAAELQEVTRQINMLAARYPRMPILAAHDPAAAGLLATALRKHGTMQV